MEAIDGFIGLQAKAYYVRTKSGKNVEKHKGVSKRTRLGWDDYNEVLNTGNDKMVKQVRFHKVDFHVMTHEISKVGLSLQNNKRIQYNKDKESLPFGYKGARFST